jgi:hypothetical protein
VFSAAHLHSTVRNQTSLARGSIDFRTVSIDDLTNRRGRRLATAPAPVRHCAIFGG